MIAALRRFGDDLLSPEAMVAAAAFEGVEDVGAAVPVCASGSELVGMGYADDVAIATELDACEVVPILASGAFMAAGEARQLLPGLPRVGVVRPIIDGGCPAA